MPLSKFYRVCIGIVLILLIIYLLMLDSFLFRPIVLLFDILILPLTFSVFFYYLLRPIVNWLAERKNMNRTMAVILLYLAIGGAFVLFALLVWPTLQKQIANFIENAPTLVENVDQQLKDAQNQDGTIAGMLPSGPDLMTQLRDYLNQGVSWASDYISALMAFVSGFVIVIATVPIILFYMLKEGGKISLKLLYMVPRSYRGEGRTVLEEIDAALGSFIVSRVVINLLLGAMMYIGFLFIGLPYALLLTLISIVLNFIPYLGAILAAIPVLVIAFIESPSMALWALLIIIVAQQIQDNILSPLIYGKQLDVHPVTIVILLLLGGNIAGILGMLLSIPVYMIVKIVAVHVYKLFFEEKVEEIVEEKA